MLLRYALVDERLDSIAHAQIDRLTSIVADPENAVTMLADILHRRDG